MDSMILFRSNRDTEDELNICRKYFATESNRVNCRDNLVIGRYSVLPFYQELESDLFLIGSRLINTYRQHKWIADFEYYDLIKEYTFETWFDWDFCNCKWDGPFVVKGKTNSRKFNWNEMMFAKDKKRAGEIANILMNDGMIAEQGVIYRKYEKLETYEIGVNGLPFTNEWRLFFYKDCLLSSGYYWSIAEKIDHVLEESGIRFAHKVAEIVKDHVNFYVMDISKTEDGRWVVVELNDGQMSGLSCNDPEVLYEGLKDALDAEWWINQETVPSSQTVIMPEFKMGDETLKFLKRLDDFEERSKKISVEIRKGKLVKHE